MPDRVTAKIAEWERDFPDLIRVHRMSQYSGHVVHGLVITAPGNVDRRRVHITHVPHAHEPAATAGVMDALNAILTGRHFDGTTGTLIRDAVLEQIVVCVIPDANPDGRVRAPVPWWDGSFCDNATFWCWMRGRDRVTGKMWKRLDEWSTTTEPDHPDPVGIVYEQIGPGEYVEPNRSSRSTLLRLMARLENDVGRFDQSVALHQSELEGWPNDCYIHLPCIMDTLAPDRQVAVLSLAGAILQAWQKGGGNPIPDARPLTYTGIEREYFIRTWGGFYERVIDCLVEVQNNSPRTPPAKQMLLERIAFSAALTHLIAK
ncbi:MAG: M14 family zinc carboxypeptidase [Planctomycetota bacterium]